MGVSYSAATIKTHLKMAGQRMMMHRNKKTNQIAVETKQISILLEQSKDESARIRAESILHEKNLVTCMEILQLMCELLAARIGLITAAKECPSDLVEACASIIYCSTRVEIAELAEITKQLGAKFGKDFCTIHLDNTSGKVHPRILQKLSVQPPDLPVILAFLHEVAAQYNIEWVPDSSSVEPDSVEQLGSVAKLPVVAVSDQQIAAVIELPDVAKNNNSANQTNQANVAPIDANQAPVAAPFTSSSSSSSPPNSEYPGTLNLIIHRARDVRGADFSREGDGIYVKITNVRTGTVWQSEADKLNAANPIWDTGDATRLYHHPFSISTAQDQLLIELYQASSSAFASCRLCARNTLYAEQLRAVPTPTWYRVYNNKEEAGLVLISSQYLPLNANIISKEEAIQHEQWRQQQAMYEQAFAQQHMQQQQGQPTIVMPLPPYQLLSPPYPPNTTPYPPNAQFYQPPPFNGQLPPAYNNMPPAQPAPSQPTDNVGVHSYTSSPPLNQPLPDAAYHALPDHPTASSSSSSTHASTTPQAASTKSPHPDDHHTPHHAGAGLEQPLLPYDDTDENPGAAPHHDADDEDDELARRLKSLE